MRISRYGPSGQRIRDFVWEVMLQAKVIRERPLPGLAHAFVFWGFCAFALVTLNHFAIGFGIRFLARRFGRFYFQLAAVFAVAGRDLDHGSLHPPVRGAPELAGRVCRTNPA